MDHPLLSIIVPVYFNGETLNELYHQIVDTFEDHLTSRQLELIFIDDDSKDHSFDLLSALAKKDSDRVKVIRMSRNFGSHAAVLAGLSYSSGKYATVIAADLQDPPFIILEMFQKALDGFFEVVLACRKGRNEKPTKVIFANLYYFIMRKFSHAKFPPGGFDCYLIERKVINALLTFKETDTSLSAQILWVGFRQATIEYVKQDRAVGKSRWTFGKKMKLLIDSLVSFSHIPIRLLEYVGSLTTVLGVFYATYIIIRHLSGVEEVRGWSSLMVVTLCFSGIILISLGMIGEYLARILDAARHRPPFIISETINLNGSNAPELEIVDRMKEIRCQ